MTKTVTTTPVVSIADTAKSGSTFSFSRGSFSQSFSGAIGSGNPGLVTVGTSEETISFGDVTPGYVLLWNTDPANEVYYGFVLAAGTGGDEADIALVLAPQGVPHEIVMRSGYNLVMKANVAPCDVMVMGFNA